MSDTGGINALVVCAAPLARRTLDIAAALPNPKVIPTPTANADGWIPPLPETWQPAARIRPATVTVLATFHTINSWTAGLNDHAALGILNDALGLGTPILIVPTIAERLTHHPAWTRSIATLGPAVDWLDPHTGKITTTPVPVQSGSTTDQTFQPGWISTWVTTHG